MGKVKIYISGPIAHMIFMSGSMLFSWRKKDLNHKVMIL